MAQFLEILAVKQKEQCWCELEETSPLFPRERQERRPQQRTAALLQIQQPHRTEGTWTQNCSLTNLTTEQKKKQKTPKHCLTTWSLLRIFSLCCDNNYCESGILNIINICIYTMCVQVLTHSEWNRSPVSSSCTCTLTTCWRQTIDQLWSVSIFILILLNNVYIFVFWFKCM